MTKGYVFNIQRYAIHDGPGIRTVIFLSGCPLRCRWCSNPESWDASGGKCFKLSEVLKPVLADKVFYETSRGGVTFSGGEPLGQASFTAELARACKGAGLHTSLETCGDVPWSAFEAVDSLIDLYLYDLKLIERDRLREWTGGDARNILENLTRLRESDKQVILRIPLIPGVNTDEPTLERMMELALELGITECNLLPYHGFGSEKYRKLGMSYQFDACENLMAEKNGQAFVKGVAKRLADRGLISSIVG